MEPLVLSTCMAPVSDYVCRELAAYISQRLQIPVELRLDVSWQERERLLDAGQIDVCWICGLPYVWKADLPAPRIELLAAPVLRGERYRGQPIYYSDVVVRRDSPFKTLADLRGASWAYNEPGSHSGYNVVRYALAVRGEASGYFGRVVASGAHEVSLEMILRGQIEASAIDSSVLEWEILKNPDIPAQIRVIDSFGPSPIPPWVIAKNTSPEYKAGVKDLLLHMHTDPQAAEILARCRMLRFAPVADYDYDPIRAMAAKAESVQLEVR